MAYIAHVVTRVGVMRWAYTIPVCVCVRVCVCVLFVSSRSGIVFFKSADAITDHNQSARDIDPYYNFELYVEEPGH